MFPAKRMVGEGNESKHEETDAFHNSICEYRFYSIESKNDSI